MLVTYPTETLTAPSGKVFPVRSPTIIPFNADPSPDQLSCLPHLDEIDAAVQCDACRPEGIGIGGPEVPVLLADPSAATNGSWSMLGISGAIAVHTSLSPTNRILFFERPHVTGRTAPQNPYLTVRPA